MFQLRNHQNTVIDILSKNRKGQVIVPTGGGKTMCMIEDAKKVSGTIVVVAPRILLAEQLSSEFLEIIDNVSVMHVHSGETTHFSSTKASDVCMWDNYTREETRLYLQHIIHYTEYKRVIFILIQYILMKHTMLFKRTLLKQLSISQYMQIDVTSSQQHQNILTHL